MKTAISIPDFLFKIAENTAKKMGISRSALFTEAIQEYIKNHNPQDITQQLDNIYSKNESSVPEDILSAQIASIELDKW